LCLKKKNCGFVPEFLVPPDYELTGGNLSLQESFGTGVIGTFVVAKGGFMAKKKIEKVCASGLQLSCGAGQQLLRSVLRGFCQPAVDRVQL
jgi:hypothetical protein